MSRRRRKPSVRIERLELRSLLSGTVTLQALHRDIIVAPGPGVTPLSAEFDLTASSGGVLPISVTFIETVSPSSSALPVLTYNGSTVTPGTPIQMGASAVIAVTPSPTLNNVDEQVTLALDDVHGCIPGYWSKGSPSSDTITFRFPANPQVTPPCPDTPPLGLTDSPGTGDATPTQRSDAGVAYGNGGVTVQSPSLLRSDGYGSIPLGVDLGWTNIPGFGVGMTPGYGASGSIFGIGMISANLPSLQGAPDGGLVALGDAGDALFLNKLLHPTGVFDFSPQFFSQDGLATDGGNYKLTRTDGTVVEYYGFGTGIPAAQRGQLDYYADPGGNVTATTYNGSGQLTAVTRSDATSSETYAYTYVGGAGPNHGLVSNVTLSRTPAGAGSAYVVQQVAFAYYGGTYSGADSYGNAGDLKSETLEDAAGNPIGTTYYRYYTPADVAGGAVGYVGGLKYQFNPQSYARLVAAQGNPLTTGIADSSVSLYADQYYEYDQYQRVTTTTVQGAGCSCSGSNGDGTYTYAYTANSTSPNLAAYNTWQTKTVETRPDQNQNIVYTNAAGEVMVRAFDDISDAGNSALSGLMWTTYDKYDYEGRLVLEAQPSAVSIASPAALATAASTYPDIVGYDGSSSYQSLRPGSGLINLTEYGGSTTATTGSAGDVDGYLKDHEVQNGYSGTAILLDSTQYIAHTAAGTTVYPVATTTVYRNPGGGGAEATSESYTWFSGTNRMQSVAESAPIVSAAQDGPGTADITTDVYDIYGRVIWTKDPDGFIGYAAYDAETGAVVTSIVDVNTALTAEFANLPSGWAAPPGGGLNLVTTAQVDGQGRTTRAVSPNGNVTYVVYDDPNHEIRTYVGWNASTGTTTGPTQVTRIDYPGNYTETLTMTATPATAGGAGNLVPTGAEAISAVQTLDRILGDNTGREVEDDAYSSLAGLTYSASSQRLGTLGTNYYATYYGYDDMGRQARVVDAVGTITDTTYDSLGRVASTAVGTDDTYTPGPAGPSNMVTVSADQYDGNQVGDGNLTRDTQSSHSTGAPDTVTVDAYDWRDRLVATKSGDQMILGPEDFRTNRPILYYDLDNLDEVVAVSQYDGDGVTLTTTRPSSSLLRAYSTTAFDDQGRAYQQQQYEVDQSTGALSANALTTTIYYDHRGDVIATYSPGGLVTKDRYDGAGRLVSESSTDGAAGTSWAEAGSDDGDHVLTQTTTTYDGDSNPITVTTADRDHDAPSALTGPLTGRAPAPTPPSVQVSDDSQAGPAYGATGGFAVYGGGFGGEHQGVYNAASATATWTFNVTPGTYTIAATWLASTLCATSETYKIYDGPTLLDSPTVDQQTGPSSFTDQGASWQQLIGTHALNSTYTVMGTTLTVTLTGVAGYWIDADAIRIQKVESAEIVDNSSASTANYSSSGGFATYSGGFNSTHQGANAAGATATWTFNVVPGTYTVAATWGASSICATAEAYTIAGGGSALGSATVNQTTGPVGFADQGVTWQPLGGTYTVTGTTLTVTLSGSAGGWVVADAVRIQPVAANQVVDDSSPAGFSSSGGFATYADGYNGTHQGANAAGATATWTFTVAPGTYTVAATWGAYSICAPSETFTIASGGSTLGTAAVDQQLAPSGFIDQQGTWQSLGGTFTVTGTTLTVTLAGSAGGWVVADAVRIQPVAQVGDDANAANYKSAGGFATFSGGFDGTHQGVYNAPSATATWTFSVTPGTYTVAADWGGAFSICAPSETFTIAAGGSALGTAVVDEQLAPVGFTDQGGTWQPLGGTFVVTGTTLTVTLAGVSGYWVAADAVRIQQVAATNARVSSATAYYDAADRPVAVVDVGTNQGVVSAPSTAIPGRSDAMLVSSVTYNAAGWVATSTDPRGIVTRTTYDALGRPIQVVDAYDASINGGLPTASANQTTDTTYDGIDDVLTVTAVMPSGTANQTTTYAYGVTATSGGSTITSNDLLASVTQPGTPTEADTYTYDALGDVLTRTDPNGTVHSYTYDSLGRQIGDAVTTLGSGVDGSVRLLTTAYDAEGNPYLFTSYADTAGTTVVNQVEDIYNGLGQLAAEYQEQGGSVNTSTTPVIQYGYTEMSGGQNNSRPTGMTYPDGRVIDYVYNSGVNSAISRVSAIVDDATSTTLESYLYLGLDTIVEEDHPQTGVNLTYIRQPSETNVNTDGGDEYIGLDRFGRVIDQNWVNASGASLARYQYGYDRDGNVLYRADLVDTALSELYHANSTTSGDNATAYDALGRLTGFARGTLSASGHNGTTPDTVASPSGSQSWSLDALGNWSGVTTNGSTTTQTFNAQNQATAVSGGTAPTYDKDGNTLNSGGLTYTYDAWNRLVGVSNPATGVAVATYAYDALGRRIGESYAGGGTNYLYYNSDWNVIEERQGGTSSSDVHYQYVYGASGNLVLRDTVSGGAIVPADRLYAEWDANGDITAITNGSGTVEERYDYSPYGVVTVLTASGSPVTGNVSAYGWQYLFQVGRQDAATGLYIFEHRDYNPISGTWMERDPLGLAAGDENLYRFVSSNPISERDPLGLSDQPVLKPPGIHYSDGQPVNNYNDVKSLFNDLRNSDNETFCMFARSYYNLILSRYNNRWRIAYDWAVRVRLGQTIAGGQFESHQPPLKKEYDLLSYMHNRMESECPGGAGGRKPPESPVPIPSGPITLPPLLPPARQTVTAEPGFFVPRICPNPTWPAPPYSPRDPRINPPPVIIGPPPFIRYTPSGPVLQPVVR